jgi:hypothetical protein
VHHIYEWPYRQVKALDKKIKEMEEKYGPSSRFGRMGLHPLENMLLKDLIQQRDGISGIRRPVVPISRRSHRFLSIHWPCFLFWRISTSSLQTIFGKYIYFLKVNKKRISSPFSPLFHS